MERRKRGSERGVRGRRKKKGRPQKKGRKMKRKWKGEEREDEREERGDRFPNVGNGGRCRVVEGKWEERGERKKKKRK